MGIENVLHEEILSVNRGIIKKRKRLSQLKNDPVIENVKIDEKCIEEITRKSILPEDSILLPITFFIPSGLSEGYVVDERDARIVELFVEGIQKRDNKFWIKKYRIRELVNRYRGCFQVIILP